MRTGEFIKKSYEIEINRIKQEMEDIIPVLNAEKEIIEIQGNVQKSRSTTLSGNILLGFDSYGGINFQIIDYDYAFSRHYLSIISQNERIFFVELENIKRMNSHISVLKQIHPKTFSEHLRHFGKEWLLS